MGPDLLVGEIPQGDSPPGDVVDGEHGPQAPEGRDVGVPTHWGGYINGGTGLYRGIYRLPPEHGHAIYFDLSYHGLVFGGRVEAGDSPIQAMVGASRPGYHKDQYGNGRHGGGGVSESEGD